METNTAYNVINRRLNEAEDSEATYEQVSQRLLPKSDDHVRYPLELDTPSASKTASKEKKPRSKANCRISFIIGVVALLIAVLAAVPSITMAILYHAKTESIMRDIAQLKSQQMQPVSLTPGINPTMLTDQLTSLKGTIRHLHGQTNQSPTQIFRELNEWIKETSSKIKTLNGDLNQTKHQQEAQNVKLNTQREIQLQIELTQAELNKTQTDSTNNIRRLQVGMDAINSQVDRALVHYQTCSKEREMCDIDANRNDDLYWIRCETNHLPINVTVSCTHTYM